MPIFKGIVQLMGVKNSFKNIGVFFVSIRILMRRVLGAIFFLYNPLS